MGKSTSNNPKLTLFIRTYEELSNLWNVFYQFSIVWRPGSIFFKQMIFGETGLFWLKQCNFFRRYLIRASQNFIVCDRWALDLLVSGYRLMRQFKIWFIMNFTKLHGFGPNIANFMTSYLKNNMDDFKSPRSYTLDWRLVYVCQISRQ